MIERNLDNVERVVRLLLGLAFGGWALAQPILNGVEWFAVMISIALILNGIFSRCYLWYILDVNTYDNRAEGSSPGTAC